MRTKTLILAAALSAASLATSMAQVYSVNMVGYTRVTLLEGLSFIANHLKTANSVVPEVLADINGGNTPFGMTLTKFTYSTQRFDDQNVFNPDDATWSNPNQTLRPGEAVFVDRPLGNGNLDVTIVGEVPTGSYPVSVRPFSHSYGAAIPQPGRLVTDLGFPLNLLPPATSLTVSFFDRATRRFSDQYVLNPDDGSWLPMEPNVPLNTGFFVDNASSSTVNWDRNFPVGP